MTHQPLLSVFVPTRNRATYAFSTVKSLLSSSDPRLQVVVQDNSETDELPLLMKEIAADARLRFRHVPERLSLSQNFTQALKECSGEYVTCIGDDDGANPEVVSAAAWAKNNEVDLLTTTALARYTWPDHKTKLFQDRLAGRLDLEPFDGSFIELDIEDELKQCLAYGGALGETRLAGVYRGIVRRSCLESVHDLIGTYYPGPSPDLACTIALTRVMKKAIQVDYPLFVPGTSGQSAHAIGRADSSELRIENKPQFESEMLERWSSLVPKLYTSTSIWAETSVQALRAIGRDDLVQELNIPLVHAQNLAKAPQLKIEILNSLRRALETSHQNVLIGHVRFLFEYNRYLGMRLRSLQRSTRAAFFPPRNWQAVSGIRDIETAVEALTQLLTAQGKSFGG